MAVMAEKPAGDTDDPPIHDRNSQGGARGPACTHRGDALAHQRDSSTTARRACSSRR